MDNMFRNTYFNNDISSWKIGNDTSIRGIFRNCKIIKKYRPKKKGKILE
jgi:hypothetical protein